MTFSRILFLAAFALLTLTSCHARAIVEGLRQTRPHKLQDMVKPLVLILCFMLCSCSTQVATAPDGTKLVNDNLLAKGGMTKNADGSVVMWGDAEKAAGELGKYGGALISAGLVTRGIEAAQSVGNNVVKSVTQ